MSGWRATFLVAQREAVERARSRAYIASTALTFVIVAGLIAVTVWTEGGPEHYRVGLTGPTPRELEAAITATAATANSEVTFVQFADTAALTTAVADKVIHAGVVDASTIVLRRAGESPIESVLTAAIRQLRLLEALEGAGIDPDTLAAGMEVEITATEPVSSNDDEAMAMAAVVLLFLVITTYGQWVLLGVLDEKSTRVVEQIVSAVSVRALLAGKVIGIGLLGIGQLLVLVAAGVGAGTVLDAFTLPASTLPTAAWSLLWFMLGFAFYAVLYAAAGSLVSRTEDAQTAAMPVALVSVAAYLGTFGLMASSEPDSMVARLVSLLPPVAPIAYPARIAAGGVPWWEICLGLAVTIAAVVMVVRTAARIYAGALLAQGGRIGLRRAWRAAGELAAR
jgi:ABC-2 type transport system permease protein